MKFSYYVSALLFGFILTFFTSSCKDDPVAPPSINMHYDYENWKVDTLRNPYGYGFVPYTIWGSSDSSVWIGGFNLMGQEELFYFNGQIWERKTPILGFNYQIVSLFGFSPNDIYAAGVKYFYNPELETVSLVLHYDGRSWTVQNVLGGYGLKYIHGRNTNDMWACGFGGSIYHKTGNVWQQLTYDEKKYLGSMSNKPLLGPLFVDQTGTVFLMSEYSNYPASGDTSMFYFSRFKNNLWEDLDSCRLVSIDGIPTGYKFGHRSMCGFSESEIYSVGERMYKFDGVEWKWLGYADPWYLNMQKGLHNTLFAVGFHGTLNYFNGEFNRIGDYRAYMVDFYSVLPFENSIFIGAFDGQGYVIHGTMKK